MFKDTHAYSGFAVDDVGRAREFYGDTLGSRPRSSTRRTDCCSCRSPVTGRRSST